MNMTHNDRKEIQNRSPCLYIIPYTMDKRNNSSDCPNPKIVRSIRYTNGMEFKKCQRMYIDFENI